MKYKVELSRILSAIHYCATADNNKDFLERWNRLKVAKQLEALANVTFLDDWQTIEQMEYTLYQAENIEADFDHTHGMLHRFLDVIPDTPENRHLYSQLVGIECHFTRELHELREYVRTKKEQAAEPEQATTPEPATEPEQIPEPGKGKITPWLRDVFVKDELAQDYLDRVKTRLEKSPTQKARATIGEFIICKPKNYKHESNARLIEEIQLCTGVKLIPQNFKPYNKNLADFSKADK